MATKSEKRSDNRIVGSRRDFLTKSTVLLAGAVAASSGIPEIISKSGHLDDRQRENDSFEIFDCHLHSPADKGEKWQWHKVTATFDDFVMYLDKTGVKRGIINSQ
jgi:hypothetical protein